MLPISSVKPARISELQMLQLFTPLHTPAAKFLPGIINETAVLVMVAGEFPFQADQHRGWQIPPEGWAISDVRFEVDQNSITPYVPFPAPGTLVISRDGAICVVAIASTAPHAVRLDSAQPVELRGGDLAISSWRIVCGPEDEPVELFKRVRHAGGTRRLSGI